MEVSFFPIYAHVPWLSKYCMTLQGELAGGPLWSDHIFCHIAISTSSSRCSNCLERNCKLKAAESYGGSSQGPKKRLPINLPQLF
jgi:hypothetical protein